MKTMSNRYTVAKLNTNPLETRHNWRVLDNTRLGGGEVCECDKKGDADHIVALLNRNPDRAAVLDGIVATRYYFADLDVSDLDLKNLEPVMDILRELGFPKLFQSGLSEGEGISPPFMRVWWEVGNPEGAFRSEGELWRELGGIEANLNSYMPCPHFTDPWECTGYPDPHDNQYIWD